MMALIVFAGLFAGVYFFSNSSDKKLKSKQLHNLAGDNVTATTEFDDVTFYTVVHDGCYWVYTSNGNLVHHPQCTCNTQEQDPFNRSTVIDHQPPKKEDEPLSAQERLKRFQEQRKNK